MPIRLLVHNKPLINASYSFTVTDRRPQPLSPCWCEQSHPLDPPAAPRYGPESVRGDTRQRSHFS